MRKRKLYVVGYVDKDERGIKGEAGPMISPFSASKVKPEIKRMLKISAGAVIYRLVPIDLNELSKKKG